MRFQIKRYRAWLRLAEEGFKLIPRRYLLPIKTASDMYRFAAWRIYVNPYITFRKKVKPPVYVIAAGYLRNTLMTKRNVVNHGNPV